MKKQKLEDYERKIIEEFGCNITPVSHNYTRSEEKYDPRADFFG